MMTKPVLPTIAPLLVLRFPDPPFPTPQMPMPRFFWDLLRRPQFHLDLRVEAVLNTGSSVWRPPSTMRCGSWLSCSSSKWSMYIKIKLKGKNVNFKSYYYAY